jgi:type IV pilus assembly protein PilO
VLKSKYTIAAILIVLGVVYAVYQFYGFYNDELPKIQAKRIAAETELNNRENELRRLKNFAQNIESVKQELRELNLQLESALESMPRTFNLSGLLRKLSLLAQNSGVDLATFKPRAPTNDTNPTAAAAKEKNFYSTITIDFTMNGSFTQTLVFFDQMTRLKRIININSLKMRNSPVQGVNKAAVSNVFTEATIETYRFSE